MIAFTILGVFMYWWTMGLIGYFGAMAYDVHRGFAEMHKSSDDALSEVMTMLMVYTHKPRPV